MTASMSFLANASSGLRGMMLTNVLTPKSAFFSSFSPASVAYRPSSCSFCSAGSRSPGRIAFTSVSPMAAAHAVVMRK